MNYKKTFPLFMMILFFSVIQQNVFAQCMPDTIPPNVICVGTPQIVVIPNLPTIVTAFSLDNGSTDNCSDSTELQYFISNDLSLTAPPTSTFLTYPANTPTVDSVELWVVDQFGNFSSCLSVLIFDSSSPCLQDTIAPIANCQGTFFIDLGQNDDFSVTPDMINNASSDNCTATNNLLLFISDSSDPNPYQNIVTYPAGTSGAIQTILTVVDEAGNESNCSTLFLIETTPALCVTDTIAPTMECQGDITVSYTGLDYVASGQSIYDFQSVSDNCTPDSLLTYFIAEGISAGPPPTTTSVTIPEGTTGWTDLTVWVVDEAGNFTSCSTRILIEPNFTLCASDTEAPTALCTGYQEFLYDFAMNVIVPAGALNDGSWDNCTATDSLQFFITEDLTATTPPTTTELIHPIGGSVTYTVALWVVDQAGNSSSCITTYLVAPFGCPPPPSTISITCDQNVYIPYDSLGYTIEPIMLLDGIGSCHFQWYDFYLSTNPNFPALEDTLFFPPGTSGYVDIFTMAIDDDGNTALCGTSVYFEPDPIICSTDSIAPTAVCQTGLTMTNIQLDDFHIFASNINNGSSDNCTSQSELGLFISFDSTLSAPPTTTELIVPKGANELVTVYLWVVDNNGNYSVCASEVLLVTNFLFNTYVFRDQNSDCIKDSLEQGLAGYTLQYTSDGSPGVSSVQSNSTGFAGIILPGSPGLSEMTVELILPNGQSSSCVTTFTIDLTTPNNFVPSLYFPVDLAADCDLMTVDIATPILRRCFPSTYSISYCNGSDYDIDDVEILVTIPPSMLVQSAGLPYTDVGNNQLLFEIGTVTSGDCNLFPLVVLLDCTTPLGATKCVQAEITPYTCDDPMQTYTGADLAVTAACSDNDQEVRFTIRNQGSSGMQSAQDYIVIEDVIMYMQNPIQLGAGDSIEVVVPANGSTWRIEIPQPAGHPSLSAVSTAIEGCVQFGSMGFINQFSQADSDPFIAIDCNEVVGSFDPNDKRAFPEGVGTEHFIDQNISLEYNIRFQNTGTDTAFTVRLEDQLDASLDFTSVQAGTSSHPYRLAVEKDGKLIFHFENINLPDSTANEAESHGFVQFRVNQLVDNPIGTVINNTAAIYFDFNDPIITNTVQHIIGEDFVINGISVLNNELYEVQIAPNPAHQFTKIQINHVEQMDATFELYNLYGQIVHIGQLENNQYLLNRGDLPAGSYVFSIRSEAQILGNGKLIFR